MPIPSSAIFMLTILLSYVGVTTAPPDVILMPPLTNLLIKSLKSSLSVTLNNGDWPLLVTVISKYITSPPITLSTLKFLVISMAGSTMPTAASDVDSWVFQVSTALLVLTAPALLLLTFNTVAFKNAWNLPPYSLIISSANSEANVNSTILPFTVTV